MTDTPAIDTPPADNKAVEPGATTAKPVVSDNEKNTQLPRAELGALTGTTARVAGSDIGLELILDVPVTVTLELGRTTLTVRDLLQLNQGSVVQFDRRVGEPLDLLVNGTLLAHGELVVVDDQFGIRLTEVVSTAQRLEKLS